MSKPPIALRGARDGPIFGRERELALLFGLIDGVAERGAALHVWGTAGIGKSTLLVASSERAQRAGMRVLRATGIQSESQLPFAGLHQLLLPVLGHADRLPQLQHAALLAAFGMAESAEAPDRFLIALAVLELLSVVAERVPLLIVVEDAQWIDRSSAEVLAFVARRVDYEPMVVLVASRDEEGSPFEEEGLSELRLGALTDAAAGALLGSRAPDLTPSVRKLLLERAEGNPLALVELPVLLATDELGSQSSLPAPLPLTERLEAAFASRATDLPSYARRSLLLAAADDEGVLNEILAATVAMNLEEPAIESLEPAVDARLIEIDGSRLIFRHPLVRSAIYQRASVAERRAAHAAWASVLTDQPDRQAWHRAAALVGPDESVAAELEAAAARARRRGAISVAIGALERAAALSEGRARQAQRLLDAAEVVSELGRREPALRFVAEAERLGLSAGDRQRAILIQDAFDAGEDAVGMERVIEVAERTWHRDADLAMNVLRRAAGKSWWVGRAKERRELLVAAVERLGVAEDNPQRLAIFALVGSDRRVARIMDRLSRIPPDGGGDPIAARLLGLAGYAVGHFEFALDALTVAIAGLRAQGRLALLAQTVVARAVSGLQLGRLDIAVPDAEEGFRLSMQSTQPLFAEYARAAQAMLAGLQGDEESAEAIAAEAERAMVPLRGKSVLWDVQLARGITAIGGGRYEDAYGHLIRTFDQNDPAEHYRKRFWAIGDLAEAAHYSGRRDEALTLLRQAEAGTCPQAPPCLLVALGYARAMLAEGAEAETLYEAALGTDLTSWPFARARLQLAYGAWLRRQRRVTASRLPLRAAKATFDALGVPPWSERTDQELRAAGVTGLIRENATTDVLTPQELQIARMAASGLSNREIGRQLYLSHRTVGAHLYRAFPKLGISSRGQLSEALGRTLP